MSLTRALTVLGFRSIHFPDDERTVNEVMGCLDSRAGTLRLAILERYDAARKRMQRTKTRIELAAGFIWLAVGSGASYAVWRLMPPTRS